MGRDPRIDEKIAKAAPFARPNETLVRLGDAELGRSGRMVSAIMDTGRDLPWPDVPEGDPFGLIVT